MNKNPVARGVYPPPLAGYEGRHYKKAVTVDGLIQIGIYTYKQKVRFNFVSTVRHFREKKV